MPRTFQFVFVGLIVTLVGCDARILNLIALSKNRTQTEQIVKRQEESFASLEEDIKTRQLSQGLSREDIRKRYGDPIVLRPADQADGSFERWLYRMPLDYASAQKAYLYFDLSGILSRWELYPQNPQESASLDGP